MTRPTRRNFLRGLGGLGGLTGLAALGAGGLALRQRPARAAPPDGGRRYLFVIGGPGGANILDSFLPVRQAESANGATLTTFSDDLVIQPQGSNIRCVAPLVDEIAASIMPMRVTYEQPTFLQRFGAMTCVMTTEGTSVNHRVGQVRMMTGGGINRGRTLLEAAGDCLGDGLALPVVNMMGGGLGEPGTDTTLAIGARQLSIQDPRTFALGTHGSLGLPHAPPDDALARAREARARLDAESRFGALFAHTQTVRDWHELRQRASEIEGANLLGRLLLSDVPGVSDVPELDQLLAAFPDFGTDVFEAQAALAYLLVRNTLTCAVGIAPPNAVLQAIDDDGVRVIENPQLAFDFAHNAHRVAQNVMWARLLRVADGLIGLLQATEDPNHPGDSLMQRSVVAFISEFGRERQRPADATTFGTGHFQNNGVVLVSPLLRGNRVYGGVDPDTCLSYGFDPATGDPRPGTLMREEDVYSVICEALGVGFEGRRSLPCLLA